MTGGRSLRIGRGPLRATVATTGATLVHAESGGHPVLSGPGRVAPELGHHGAVLAPWPNRTGRGRYEFDGVRHQLPVDDAAYGHAIHGFAYAREWRVDRHTPDEVSLSLELRDEPGYPFHIGLSVGYRATPDTLRCEARWSNLGRGDAPFGIGFHPYLLPGPSALDRWLLEVPADTVLDVDPATALPTRLLQASGTEFDFRTARPVGTAAFSRAFGALRRTDGHATVRVTDPERFTLQMEVSAAFGWVQVFTGDLPDPRHRRRGLAVEPQTCPPNALATGQDLLRLRPGRAGTAWWRLRVSQPYVYPS
ncbi:aldose epimerase family protein [Jiangella endophytica]|uniref:aldose epimerase family protein n=1 Tax=Jiangella endophytica TaxID=1623398 RepID=UPI000E3461AA|nr:hypothetical protein [Jiangella endophytica]